MIIYIYFIYGLGPSKMIYIYVIQAQLPIFAVQSIVATISGQLEPDTPHLSTDTTRTQDQ